MPLCLLLLRNLPNSINKPSTTSSYTKRTIVRPPLAFIILFSSSRLRIIPKPASLYVAKSQQEYKGLTRLRVPSRSNGGRTKNLLVRRSSLTTAKTNADPNINTDMRTTHVRLRERYTWRTLGHGVRHTFATPSFSTLKQSQKKRTVSLGVLDLQRRLDSMVCMGEEA